MTLEIDAFPVRDVVLAERTDYADEVLSIDSNELRDTVLKGGPLDDVDVDVIRPGDDCRVVHVVDVVEPRIRVSEPGTDFPGMLSVPRTVGKGRTHSLAGVVVTGVAEPISGEPAYYREAIFDMRGDGAKCSPLSNLIHVVLTFHPTQRDARASAASRSASTTEQLPPSLQSDESVGMTGTAEAVEYNHAIRLACLRAAVYLAEATIGGDFYQKTLYDLDPCDGLPRVVYLFQMTMPHVYGELVPSPSISEVGGHGALPTIIHPNEILDGALVSGWVWAGCARDCTYAMQNHPIIHELYARHTREIDFRGVVLYTNGASLSAKERTSSYAANLALLLGADGAILSYQGSGHPAVDLMMTCQKLEKEGVKTTLLLMEMAANPEDSGFVYFVREADAIVSTGNYEEVVNLGPLSRVIGGARILDSDDDAAGPLSLPLRHILLSTDQFGSHTIRGREY